MNWIAFKDEKPSRDGMYLCTTHGMWRKARWRDGEFSESCGANCIKLTSPEYWAEVELP